MTVNDVYKQCHCSRIPAEILATFDVIGTMQLWRRQTRFDGYCQPSHGVERPKRSGTSVVDVSFEPGEAFQFGWRCEYAFVGGLRRRLELGKS